MKADFIKLSYNPFIVSDNLNIDLSGYQAYINASSNMSILENIIKTFDEAVKADPRTKFDFDDFSLSKHDLCKKPSISWKSVYEKLLTFIEIRLR